MESRVANPIGAKPGDLVKVHLSSDKFFTGAAILYLLPVLGILIGAFTGAWVATSYGFTEISGSIAGALAGLGVGYAAVMAVDRSPRIRQQIIPTITAIVTPKSGRPNSKKAPCCG
jgi:sigma-E factor negative regulatory protein RseC